MSQLTFKTLGRNPGANLFDSELGNDLFDVAPKAKLINQLIDK